MNKISEIAAYCNKYLIPLLFKSPYHETRDMKDLGRIEIWHYQRDKVAVDKLLKQIPWGIYVVQNVVQNEVGFSKKELLDYQNKEVDNEQ